MDLGIITNATCRGSRERNSRSAEICQISSKQVGRACADNNHKLFSEKTSAYVDKTWFNIFQYDFVAGNALAFGQSPFSIILTETKANKYFGNANAIGQVIRIDTVNYTVVGVIKDNPVNSSFQFDVLLQMDGCLSD